MVREQPSKPTRHEDITPIIEDKYYIKDSIPVLEEYLKEQIRDETYDFEANKTLIKLYLLFPADAKEELCALALVKSLTLLPQTDFVLLSYVLPEETQGLPSILAVKEGARLLETAQFKEWWAHYKQNEALFKQVPNFSKKIQQYILETHAQAFQRMPVDDLAVALASDKIAGMACLDGNHNLGRIEGPTFVFHPNAENQSKPKKFKENVDFQSMASALSRLAS